MRAGAGASDRSSQPFARPSPTLRLLARPRRGPDRGAAKLGTRACARTRPRLKTGYSVDRLSTASGPAARSDRATGLWGRLHRMLRWQPEWSTVRLVMTFLPIVLASAGALTDYNTTRRQIEDRVSATAAMMTIYVATALDQATTSSMVVADHLGRYNLRSRPQSIVETALLAD